jgi:Lrp/AsnC family transcriptional regulator, leucine-responsive regulatory protein
MYLRFDSEDLKIIKLLQRNARISIADIARSLQLSPNAALNRYKKILNSGIIKKTFIPVFLPKYVGYKNVTFKMQLIVRSELKETDNIINFVKKTDLKDCQIECFETTGHYNIFVWIISDNAIDVQIIKDKIQSQKGIQEVKVAILDKSKDFYTGINLDHLRGKEIYGSN